MNELLHVHSDTPQPRRIRRAADIVGNGGVIAMPTDSSYALACALGDRQARDRIRRLRGLHADHLFTLLCRDLSEISRYAKVENRDFRLLKAATPGGYTFVLPATKQVPNWLVHPKRRTIGIRVPDHAVAGALIEAVGEPLMSVTAEWPNDEGPIAEATDVREAFVNGIDIILDAGATGLEGTTVIDLTGEVPTVLRHGTGPLDSLGLDAS